MQDKINSKLGNLILRTMAFEDFNNSRYFEKYRRLFIKLKTCSFEHFGILNTWKVEYAEFWTMSLFDMVIKWKASLSLEKIKIFIDFKQRLSKLHKWKNKLNKEKYLFRSLFYFLIATLFFFGYFLCLLYLLRGTRIIRGCERWEALQYHEKKKHIPSSPK